MAHDRGAETGSTGDAFETVANLRWHTLASCITNDGNVGIGTTSPISELQVHDETGSSNLWVSAGAGAAYLTLDDRNSSVTDGSIYRLVSK